MFKVLFLRQGIQFIDKMFVWYDIVFDLQVFKLILEQLFDVNYFCIMEDKFLCNVSIYIYLFMVQGFGEVVNFNLFLSLNRYIFYNFYYLL